MKHFNLSTPLMAKEDAAQASAPAATPAGTTQLRDISIKRIGGVGKEAVKQEKRVYMGRIWGEAAELKTGEDRSGKVYTYFVGDFMATNSKGETFESQKMFIPKSAEDVIQATIKKNNAACVFAFDIWAEPAETSMGYQYVLKPLLNQAATNKMKEIGDKLGAVPKA